MVQTETKEKKKVTEKKKKAKSNDLSLRKGKYNCVFYVYNQCILSY